MALVLCPALAVDILWVWTKSALKKITKWGTTGEQHNVRY